MEIEERVPGMVAKLRHKIAGTSWPVPEHDGDEAGCTFCLVVLPGDRRLAARTIDSLVSQQWMRWHAVVIRDSGRAQRWLPQDDRVSVSESADAVSAANRAIADTEADFVLFLSAGDQLTRSCLFRVAREAHRDPVLDLVYWDDALLSARGARRYRPSWSPDTLWSANYIGNAFAMRRRRLLAAGGLRAEAGDALLWDALLRASFDAVNVMRLPRLLSYRITRPELADEAGRRVVQDDCDRRGLAATAELAHGAVRLRWHVSDPPHASIVVPTRHNRPLLEKLFAGLRSTDYPSFDIIVVDNGERTPANEGWYQRQGLPLTVIWWDEPFNYSAVNNRGARAARGELLVFLNDDIEVLDTGWLRELAGWTGARGVGVVGMQLLDSAGRIQHGGVVVGVTGFAAHLFQGMEPGSNSLMGSTRWYRDVLAVTGACLAVRRDVFDDVGGFDERFILCGSDVALGLAIHVQGRRNVCTSLNGLRHAEAATRGSDIPSDDFHTSYWAYQPWLHGGDPFFSPGLSTESGIPCRRGELDPAPLDLVGRVIGRRFDAFRSKWDLEEAGAYAARYRASRADERAVRELHVRNRERFEVRTINWFIPGLDSPFYGGINTAFRIADHLARHHHVTNRFVVMGRGPKPFIRAGIAAAFPALRDSPIEITESSYLVDTVPAADIAIATLWTTAFDVARYAGARRKFYLIQDFEPMFYPAGTLYALAEESYLLGLYGICNTANLANVYRRDYGGHAISFTPAVDTSVFNAFGRVDARADGPATLFVYARPGHWRNCWELAYEALLEAKRRMGDRLRIVAAGSWAIPEDERPDPCIRQLGLLGYRATGVLYRQCDIGLALTVSAHPSYLPLELMACGVAVVAFDNPAGHWLLTHEENALLTPRTVDGLADAVERLVVNPPLRRRLGAAGLARIQRHHSNWQESLEGIYEYLCDPEQVLPEVGRAPIRHTAGATPVTKNSPGG